MTVGGNSQDVWFVQFVYLVCLDQFVIVFLQNGTKLYMIHSIVEDLAYSKSSFHNVARVHSKRKYYSCIVIIFEQWQ